MKQKIKPRAALAGAVAMLTLIFLSASLIALPTFGQQNLNSQGDVSAKDKQVVTAFEKRVKEYVRLREQLEGTMPKLPAKSTSEQIEAHKTAFEDMVRTARDGAKHGDLFRSDIAEYIRATIRGQFKGKDRRELRKMVLEADTKGVPLRINYPYPANKELVEMPPTLLLKLPQLPKQMRYRFVNRHMLLVDRENGLIIDYMLDAVP
ncbi:MAG: hypothetical protein H0U54_08155 [Acidobacteria bacterium]|nr:hypothetical protein [Acidobacteriota bacterium]